MGRGKPESTTGTGICPILSSGQNVGVACKGDKCHFWHETECYHKSIGYLGGICDELGSIREVLKDIQASIAGGLS